MSVGTLLLLFVLILLLLRSCCCIGDAGCRTKYDGIAMKKIHSMIGRTGKRLGSRQMKLYMAKKESVCVGRRHEKSFMSRFWKTNATPILGFSLVSSYPKTTCNCSNFLAGLHFVIAYLALNRLKLVDITGKLNAGLSVFVPVWLLCHELPEPISSLATTL